MASEAESIVVRVGVGEADNRFFTFTQCALEAKISAGSSHELAG